MDTAPWFFVHAVHVLYTKKMHGDVLTPLKLGKRGVLTAICCGFVFMQTQANTALVPPCVHHVGAKFALLRFVCRNDEIKLCVCLWSSMFMKIYCIDKSSAAGGFARYKR